MNVRPSEILPTIKVSDGGDGFITINASDYNPAEHELFEPEAQKAVRRAPIKKPPKHEDDEE
jgi:hypothetical protein